MNNPILGLEVYQQYMRLKLHYQSKKIYPIKSLAKHITKESFLKRNDRIYFYQVSNMIDRKKYLGYFIASMVHHRKILHIADIIEKDELEVYRQWIGRIGSIQNQFKDTVIFLLDTVGEPDTWFEQLKGYPLICQYGLSRKIPPESYCVLMSVFQKWDTVSKDIADMLLWPMFENTMMKYNVILKYDVDSYRSYLNEILTKEGKTNVSF